MDLIDSRVAWRQLMISFVISTIGCVGLWSYVVSLPAVQAEFGVSRGDASLPYTLVSLGFAAGGIIMGRLSDRFGIVLPLALSAVLLPLGYVASAMSGSLWQLALAHGLLLGFGSSTSFSPVIADVSHWFQRSRGVAVAVAASGNYLAGTIWPPIIQRLIAEFGWRQTYVIVGVFCLVTIVPLTLLLHRRPPAHHASAAAADASGRLRQLGLSANGLTILLALGAITCCLAMAMPQVHIVAYCGDLGYGPARGAEMLSLMLGFGIVSRLASGFVADKIGGISTLLIGSVMQAAALLLYVFFDSLVSLYAIAIVFGLFQGGIVPSYAIIVREYLPPAEAGTRVALVMMASLFGMAAGGLLSGYVFDYTGSYQAAFASGFFWNLLNIMIALWLLMRPGTGRLARA